MESHRSICELVPVELITSVLAFLPLPERGSTACVSSVFRKAAAKPELWRTLECFSPTWSWERVSAFATSHGQFVVSATFGVAWTNADAAVAAFMSLPKLRQLFFDQGLQPPWLGVNGNVLQRLEGACPLLQVCGMEAGHLEAGPGDRAVERFACSHAQLRIFNLSFGECPNPRQTDAVSGASLELLARHCPALESITLRHNIVFHDGDLRSLPSLAPTLRQLNLEKSDLDHISGSGLRSLGQLTKLEVLTLGWLEDDEESYVMEQAIAAVVERMPALRKLQVEGPACGHMLFRALARCCPELQLLFVNDGMPLPLESWADACGILQAMHLDFLLVTFHVSEIDLAIAVDSQQLRNVPGDQDALSTLQVGAEQEPCAGLVLVGGDVVFVVGDVGHIANEYFFSRGPPLQPDSEEATHFVLRTQRDFIFAEG